MNTNGTIKTRRVNAMKKADEYKFMQWLDTKRDYLRNQRLTAQQIAEEATKAVGAMVTRNNVVSACRALEFSLPKSSINRVSKARRRIQELEAKVGELEARLSHLEAQLGVTAKVA